MEVFKIPNSFKIGEVDSQLIEITNWQAYNYRPKVSFKISHSADVIYLSYFVEENYILAQETKTNGAVYKDSCVEFFITFDDINYYNFEFNCIGTKYIAYGSEREIRKKIETSIVDKVRTYSSLGEKPFEEKEGDFKWRLYIEIPKSCFTYTDINDISNRSARANFYKCGDDLTKPHFLTWKPVNTVNPDFHQIDFLYPIYFE